MIVSFMSAKRARLPCGKRKLRVSRKKLANSHPDTKEAGISEHQATDNIVVEERWWVKKGFWAIETCNGNSWDSLSSAMLARSEADVVFGQETKTFSPAAMKKAEREARKLGWNPVLSKAHQASAHMGSGGGAILARAGMGIAPGPEDLIPESMAHRLQLAWIGAMLKGGIHTLNIYLKDSEGLLGTPKDS